MVAGTRPTVSRAAVRYRLLLLSCIFCGLIQKPLIAFAWDMQAFEDALYALQRKKRTWLSWEALPSYSARSLHQGLKLK